MAAAVFIPHATQRLLARPSGGGDSQGSMPMPSQIRHSKGLSTLGQQADIHGRVCWKPSLLQRTKLALFWDGDADHSHTTGNGRKFAIVLGVSENLCSFAAYFNTGMTYSVILEIRKSKKNFCYVEAFPRASFSTGITLIWSKFHGNDTKIFYRYHTLLEYISRAMIPKLHFSLEDDGMILSRPSFETLKVTRCVERFGDWTRYRQSCLSLRAFIKRFLQQKAHNA
jgi:hypothetical protein